MVWCSNRELSAVLWAEVVNACKLKLFSNSSYKGKADVHVQLTQTHWERLQTFSHFNYHNLMSRIHAQMLFMAEDQHTPCNANQVPKLFCMHCSFSETKSLYRIWVRMFWSAFVGIFSKIAKVHYPVIFIINSL